jgi:hypothetical protein
VRWAGADACAGPTRLSAARAGLARPTRGRKGGEVGDGPGACWAAWRGEKRGEEDRPKRERGKGNRPGQGVWAAFLSFFFSFFFPILN